MFSAHITVLRCAFQRCRALLRLNTDNALPKLTFITMPPSPSQHALLSLSVSHFRPQIVAPKTQNEVIFIDPTLPLHRTQSFRRYTSDDKQKTTAVSVENVCKLWSEKMEKENVPEPRLSVEFIVAHVLGKKTFHGIDRSHELSEQHLQLVNSLCLRRMQFEPVQYIVGGWDFENIELILRPPVFIPRIETEELVGLAAKKIVKLIHFQLERRCMLEFCCGSGAISLALLRKFPSLRAVAVDVSPEACSLTEENAQQLGLINRLNILQGSVTDQTVKKHLLELGPFDILVTNPPYMPHAKLCTLDAQTLNYEDIRAIDGGEDGLDVVRDVLRLAPSVLKRKSDILLEINPGQGEQIKQMVAEWKQARLQFVSSHNDYLERERFCHLQTV